MEKYLPILRNSSFFKGLTDEEILSILHCVEATTLSKERDSYIFRAADSTEVMGLVVSGCVLVTCPTACEHHQKLIRNLVSVLANKILILNDKITHIGKRTTREKLLSYLSAESIRHSSLSFDIPFDRQQLADYLCIDRAAMSTEISKLQKEGFIKTNRNHFELTVSNDADSTMKM
ncbi:transcriptional regulator FixK [Dorea longicatena]|uniref:Transcriptional regulator FixK n=1 Tax=Dorea longicatena TaxID=88431 RepID=A0A564UEX1_9FIRM|nr:helix-turn-helix domain-containing protein [Dorea longicatena]VUX18086.1 transcriptional regulator FixK [Dorea longicatena]